MPDWVENDSVWEKAKEAALKTYKESDEEFYPVVTSIYKKMGGKVKHHVKVAKANEIEDIVETIFATCKESEKSMKEKEVFICATNAENYVHCRECSGTELITAGTWEFDKPTRWQWMPSGVHTIYAHYDGQPIELTVRCDEQTAKSIQASYNQRVEKEPNVEPFGCIEHDEKAAFARLPKGIAAFEWNDTPSPGVYCTGTPTKLGVDNVNGKIFRSFSPSFSTNAEYNKTRKVGNLLVFAKGAIGSKENPATVTGVALSVGSLTNKPAFRKIAPVTASEINASEVEGEEQTTKEIEASGTSEGVSKGWLKRKGFKGHSEASREAWEHSTRAEKTNERNHHYEAAMAHHSAYLAHKAEHYRLISRGQDTGEHEVMGRAHHDKFAEHLRKSEDYRPVAASETEPTELEIIYSKLSTTPKEVEDIYARIAEPEDPLQSIYDRIVSGGNNTQPAECK